MQISLANDMSIHVLGYMDGVHLSTGERHSMKNGINGSVPPRAPRKFLWVRRPTHRHSRFIAPEQKWHDTVHDAKLVPLLVLFSTIIFAAAALAIFVH